MNHEYDMMLSWVRSHYFGKYRGVVTDTDDETKRARLKVRIPSVLGSLELWAMPCVPYAGTDAGFFTLPDEGTGVWIEFEGGDPSYPVWTGFFWGDGDLPDAASSASTKVWKTASVTITIDDDAESISIDNGTGTIGVESDIELTAGSGSLTVEDSAVSAACGKGKIELSDAGVDINDNAFTVS